MHFRCSFARWGARGRWWARARGAALGAGAACIAGPLVAAETGPVLAQIEWQGGSCGSAADFADRISRRTERVRFVKSSPQLRLRVRIEPNGAALRARVSFLAAGKPPVQRQIDSPDCDDALDALALVVAIGIDERWRDRRAPPSRRPPRPPPRPRPPEPAPPPEEPPGVFDQGPADARVALPPVTIGAAPPPASPPRAPIAPAPRLAPVRDDHGLRWATGASAQLLTGVAPEPAYGAELWLRVRWERGSLLSPEVGLSLAHARASNFVQPEGQADFALSTAALELCPLRLGTPALHLQPCVASSAGWLIASGHHTFRRHSVSRPWVSVGGGAQALATLGSVVVRLSGGAVHPLLRDGFRFDGFDCLGADCGGPAFHLVANVVWSLGAGVGLSFR